MQELKKVISLNQSSKISGYSQDYLGSLVRKGEIKATKVGKSYFTTEEEINDYIFRKEVKNQKLAIRGFFSSARIKKIFIVTLFLATLFIIFWVRFIEKKNYQIQIEEKVLSSEAENLQDFK